MVLGGVAGQDAVVLFQLPRMRRPAPARQIGRGAADDAMAGGERMRQELRVGHGAGADGQVEAAADQVHHRIRGGEVDAHRRVQAQEFRDQGGQDALPEGNGGGDAQLPDHLAPAQRQRGLAPHEAIREACLLRFRPILMTTMAALLGALPLMLGTGVGSELRHPLGITMVGGLLVSQVLTLFTTPVIYLAFDRLARRLESARLRAGESSGSSGADR